jgi:hypothetical protein
MVPCLKVTLLPRAILRVAGVNNAQAGPRARAHVGTLIEDRPLRLISANFGLLDNDSLLHYDGAVRSRIGRVRGAAMYASQWDFLPLCVYANVQPDWHIARLCRSPRRGFICHSVSKRGAPVDLGEFQPGSRPYPLPHACTFAACITWHTLQYIVARYPS